MSPHRRLRLPISTRHAFALAFDLALRRDPIHSLLVPAILAAPWALADLVLPDFRTSDHPAQVLGLTAIVRLGDFVTFLLITAMLRFRARSVFNTPLETRPAPALDCYARGLRRVPWLFVTEIVRYFAIVFGSLFFVLPGIFLGFRLSFATEAVVLHDPNTEAAFRRSFHITPGRFERWFEMIVVSVTLVLGVLLFATLLWWGFFRGVDFASWSDVVYYIVKTGLLPVFQYAWTFFYLRLVEADVPPGVEVGPLYAERAPDGQPAVPAPEAAANVPFPAAPPAPPAAT